MMERFTGINSFATLEALQQEHQLRLNLIRERRSQRRQGNVPIEVTSSQEASSALADIETFVAQIQATGANVEAADQRRSLNSILDYWASELVARDEGGAFRAVPKPVPYSPSEQAGFEQSPYSERPSPSTNGELEELNIGPPSGSSQNDLAADTTYSFPDLQGFDTQAHPTAIGPVPPSSAAGEADPAQYREIPSAEPVLDDETRGEIIRIGAIARQWRREGLDGYLLSGAALNRALDLCTRNRGNAKAVVEADHDIAVFLDNSQRIEREAGKRKSRILYSVIGVLFLVSLALSWLSYLAITEQRLALRAQSQAELAKTTAEEAERQTRQALDEANEARRSMAVAQAQALAEKAAADAEAELRRQGAGRVVDELRKASAGPAQSDILQSLIASLEPIADRDDVLKGGPPNRTPQMTDGNVPEILLTRLIGPDEAARVSASGQLVTVLNDPGTKRDVFIQTVDRILDLTGSSANPGGSDLARRAALTVLADVNQARWAANAESKASVRAEIATLLAEVGAGRMTLAPKDAASLQVLRNNVDWAAASGYRVDFQFAGFVRAQAQAISAALKSVGWKILGEERTALAARLNEIRYGDPKDEAAAALLAADLRHVVGSTTVKVVRAAIPAGRLEVWISR